MSDLNIFKKQAKKLFNEIQNVDLITTYGFLYNRETTIARSLGYKNFNDCLIDVYHQENLLSYQSCDFQNDYDFLSHNEPSFFILELPKIEFFYKKNVFGSTELIIEDEDFLYSKKMKYEDNTLVLRELSQYPTPPIATPMNSVLINIKKDAGSVKIDPINVVIKQLNYCIKFFSPQISSWVHELINNLCPENTHIDITTFEHLFNLRYLLKVKDKSPLLAKYLQDLAIVDTNPNHEQIEKHKLYCGNALKMAHVIKMFPNCFESVRLHENHHIIGQRNENMQKHVSLNIDSTIDDMHLLAGDMAMTAFLEIVFLFHDEKVSELSQSTKIFSDIYFFGILKHHTLITYMKKNHEHNLYVFVQCKTLNDFKDWQKEILFENRLYFANQKHNISHLIPSKLKIYLFNSFELDKKFRKEFKGNYQFYVREQYVNYKKNNLKKHKPTAIKI